MTEQGDNKTRKVSWLLVAVLVLIALGFYVASFLLL